MLKAVNISKSFYGIPALKNVNLNFEPGKVTAILGENGAGKSTLLKILSGVYQDYSGEIFLNDQSVKFSDVVDSQNAGIAIIHQELNLIPHLSIVDNLFLGKEKTNAFGLLDQKFMMQKASELLKMVGLEVSPLQKINDLRVGEQQLVEIAKALLFDAQIICMDEPTSALSTSEIDKLHSIIKTLKSSGKIIVYISHKMDELFAISDNFEVLRDGESTGSGEIAKFSADQLIQMMVGRGVKISNQKKNQRDLETLFEVQNLSLKSTLKNISFELKKGECLGIFGLMGAGRTELLSAIFGINKHSGTLKIHGQEVKISSPKDAISYGMAYVTEDRKDEGLVLGMNVSENISLTTLKDFDILHEANEKDTAHHFVASLNIKTPSIESPVQNLSGGNQQKVVLAKWLNASPQILLLDEPTRGIDINAKNEIYQLIENLTQQGKSIIIASSEITELLALSDRILVLSEGSITANIPVSEASEDILLKAAIA